jgi:hypothetical protein
MKKLLLLPGSLWLRQSELSIRTPEGVLAARGVYIGEGLSLPYYRKLYRSPVTQSRRVPIWRVRRSLIEARAASDVVLVELNPLLTFLLPGDGWVADAWVQQETDLTSERYRRRARGIERGWGQKVRRQGFQCRFSRDEGALERFYGESYLPYVRQRYGDGASVRRLSELRAALRSGFLLQVWRDKEWVSGLVASRDGQRVRLLASGAGSPQLVHEGALSATYYFLFRWAREAGMKTVDFCGSRPHLLDGVFRHKSLWAAEPRHDPWHHTEMETPVYTTPGGGHEPKDIFTDSRGGLPRDSPRPPVAGCPQGDILC